MSYELQSEISFRPAHIMMNLFKAWLWSSVLSLTVSAAPQNILAGRVLSGDVGHLTPQLTPQLAERIEFIRNLQSLSPFLGSGGFPAFSLLGALPSVSAVQTVPALTPLRTVPAVPAVTPVRAVPAVPAVQAVPPVRTVQVAQAVQSSYPTVQSAKQSERVSEDALPPLLPVSDPTLISRDSQQEKDLQARYMFGYSVSDRDSGDSKTRQESRDGDLVTGSYTVADPDGRLRTVTYTADSVHGFQAKVTYDGEEGPVAIPFNPPTPAHTQSPDPVVIARNPDTTDNQESSGDDTDYDYNYDNYEYDNIGPVDNNLPPLSRVVPTISPTPVTTGQTVIPGLVGLPRVSLRDISALQALLTNNLRHGVAVRAGAAPLDLSQFTFLSNGQIIG